MTQWLTQDQARQMLGVRPQTLYSYASRGQIGVCSDPADSRRSLYRAEDVSNLVKRKQRRRKPAAIAASAMFFGEPCINTQISTISQGRLFFRGQDAVTLSNTATLESIAAILWETTRSVTFRATAAPLPPSTDTRARAFAFLGSAAAGASPSHGRAISLLHAEAESLVGGLAEAFGAVGDNAMPLHARLAVAWHGTPESAELIRRALVLLADQELTTSAFAARVAVSTGASLSASALAGLATLTGPLHGDATVRVRALFAEVAQSSVETTVQRYIACGLPTPGFGHPLYPDGDPRAAALLASFTLPPAFARVVHEVAAATGLRPTIDVALAAMVKHCNLPPEAAFALFAIGRSVGWIAHSIEQITSGDLIRPRASYTGPELTM